MKKETGIEIGIYTFGELLVNPLTGELTTAQQRMKEMIDAAKLADDAGLDVFGAGEHHRLDFAVSAPPVMLAAISHVTKQIKLVSATTVLSTIDPVRLFEDFATLDILSSGRAEIIAGRGAFLDSFPLFGCDVNDYNQLFAEKMELLLKLNDQELITWQGHFRPNLQNAEISPRPIQSKLPIWIGTGGSLESAAYAGRLGTGLTLVILGGDPALYKPQVEAYRNAGFMAGHRPNHLKVAIAGHCYISKTSKQAKQEFFPFYLNYFRSFMKGGSQVKISQTDFAEMAGPQNSLFIGSPQEVIEKILRQYELFGHQRFLAQMDIGGLPFDKAAESIELLATEVAPVVRRETKKGSSRK